MFMYSIGVNWWDMIEICNWCNWYVCTWFWNYLNRWIKEDLWQSFPGSDINGNGPTGHIQWQWTYGSYIQWQWTFGSYICIQWQWDLRVIYTMTMDLRVIYICTMAMRPSGQIQWNPKQMSGLICHRIINWTEWHVHMYMDLILIFVDYCCIYWLKSMFDIWNVELKVRFIYTELWLI